MLAVYPLTAVIFWVGTACLVITIVLRLRAAPARTVLLSPLVLIVTLTFVLNLLYALYDFQYTPDTLPFMPYPVIGAAVLVGELTRRAASQTVARAVAVVARGGRAGRLVVRVRAVQEPDRTRRTPWPASCAAPAG